MKLTIDITNKCNLKCKHCGNIKELLDVDEVDFVEILKKIPYDISRIDLMGGEPLLYNKLGSLLSFLEENNIEYSIITNGQFESSVINKMVLSNLSNISISIDGLEEENDFVRGTGTFKKACNFISTLIKNRKEKTRIGINFVINKLNYRKMDNIIRGLLELKIDYINLNQIFELGNALKNIDLLINDEEYLCAIENVCSFFGDEIRKKIITFDQSNPMLNEFLNIKYNLDIENIYDICDASRNSLYIDNNGDVYPCRNYKKKINIDNLYCELIEKSTDLIKFEMKKIINSYCQECIFVKECYICPISQNKRYLLCQKIEDKFIDFYDGLKDKIIIFNSNYIVFDVNKQVYVVNPSLEVSYIFSEKEKVLFDNIKNGISLLELSKKCNINYYQISDIIVRLKNKGVLMLK